MGSDRRLGVSGERALRSAALAQQWYVTPSAVVPPTNWLVAIDVSGMATSNHTDFLYGATTFALGGTLQQIGLRCGSKDSAALRLRAGADQRANHRQAIRRRRARRLPAVWNWGSLGTYVGANVREKHRPLDR